MCVCMYEWMYVRMYVFVHVHLCMTTCLTIYICLHLAFCMLVAILYVFMSQCMKIYVCSAGCLGQAIKCSLTTTSFHLHGLSLRWGSGIGFRYIYCDNTNFLCIFTNACVTFYIRVSRYQRLKQTLTSKNIGRLKHRHLSTTSPFVITTALMRAILKWCIDLVCCEHACTCCLL